MLIAGADQGPFSVSYSVQAQTMLSQSQAGLLK